MFLFAFSIPSQILTQISIILLNEDQHFIIIITIIVNVCSVLGESRALQITVLHNDACLSGFRQEFLENCSERFEVKLFTSSAIRINRFW